MAFMVEGPRSHRGPVLRKISCSSVSILKFLRIFLTRDPHFNFALGPTLYEPSPAPDPRYWKAMQLLLGSLEHSWEKYKPKVQ